MKKIILSLVAVAIVSATSFGQQTTTAPAKTPAAAPDKSPKSAEQRTDRFMLKATMEYGLTEEQKPQVKAIILTREIQRDELRKQNPGNNEAFQSAFKKVNSETDREIKALLTPAQIEHQKQFREEQRQRNKDNAAKKASGETPPPPAAPATK